MRIAITRTLVALLCLCGTSRVTAQTNAAPEMTPERRAQIQGWRESIADIFRQRAAVRHRFLLTKGKHLPKIYAQRISEFDTSQCPKSFRVAWIDYCQSWQKLSHDPSGILPAIEVVVGAVHGNILMAGDGVKRVAKDSEKKQQDASATVVAMMECQKIAIKYGAKLDGD